MSPLAHLLLAACALAAPLQARAAAISGTPDCQKKIPAVIPENTKQPSPVDLSHELIDPNEPLKEIENQLRVKPAEDIPVAVVVGAVEPSVKINEVEEDDDAKRPQVDLENPGPPQRQEHETQNPELHSDEQLKISTIKENIEQTQILLKKNIQGVSDDIVNWVKIEDEEKIQQNIQNLRDTFTTQIQKLNGTIRALAQPESIPAQEKQEPLRDYKKIESYLQTLEDDFNNEVETLSAGVGIVASLKSASDVNANADDLAREEAPAASTPTVTPASPPASEAPAQSTPNPPLYFIVQMMQTMYNGTVDRLQAVQNLLTSPTPPSETQADQPDGTPSRPSLINQVSQFFNFNLAQIRPNGTLFQLPNFNNPIGQFLNQNSSNPPQWPSWLNLPGATTVKPAEVSTVPSENSEAKPEAEEKPAEAAAAPPASQPPAQADGPIRQFLNPIAQSITSTVQRIQNTITNRDTPREPAQKNDNLSTKGGWYGGGRPGGSGDNIDSGVNTLKSEEIKEPIKEEPKKEAENDKEVKPEVPEKTE